MHEMSIAAGILGIVRDYAEQNHATKVREVGLLLGEMAGVEEESLAFSWRVLTQGTPAEGAALKIRHVPLIGRCTKCGKEFHIEHYDFWCPECKDGVLKTISGREMQVEYLEVD